MRNYQTKFDRLLTGVNLFDENANSCFLGGLKPALNKSVRIQAPRTLTQTCKITKLQKEVFEAQAPSGENQNPILPIPPKFQKYQRLFPVNNLFTEPFESSYNRPSRIKNGNSGRKLLTAEMDEERAKGLCFLCDEN